jgi:hypothetical protein
VRACYNLLSDEEQSAAPDPPARTVATEEGCNVADINHGVSGNLIDPGTDVLPAGTYRIKNAYSSRYLSSTNTCFLNCCDLMQLSNTSGNEVLWVLEKVPGAVFSSYTIKSRTNTKVIDADALTTGQEGCTVHLCDRIPVGIRTNQEWRLEKLPNGNYRIKCVAGDKPIQVAPGCASQDGCRFELSSNTGATQEWIFQKVN